MPQVVLSVPPPNTPFAEPVKDQSGRVAYWKISDQWHRFMVDFLRRVGGNTGIVPVGPSSSTDNAAVRWNGTGGDTLQNSGVIIDDSNNVSGVALLTTTGNIELGHASDTTLSRTAAGRVAIEGLGIIKGPASSTDNAVARFNLATGELVQNSGVIIDDSNNITGVVGLTASGQITLTVAIGTAPLVVTSTTKVVNLNADLLDDQSGAYYLDSANFTGLDWTDLTDGGETTLHTHAATGVTNFHALIAAHVDAGI